MARCAHCRKHGVERLFAARLQRRRAASRPLPRFPGLVMLLLCCVLWLPAPGRAAVREDNAAANRSPAQRIAALQQDEAQRERQERRFIVVIGVFTALGVLATAMVGGGLYLMVRRARKQGVPPPVTTGNANAGDANEG